MTAPVPLPALNLVTALAAALLLAGCPATVGPAPGTAIPVAERACPEQRATQDAPATYQRLASPLPPTPANLARGRELYEAERPGGSCAACHGVDGNGLGPMGLALAPPPRDFTCVPTMTAVSDGQLYWIIENGSGDFHQPARQGAQQVPRPGRRESFTAMSAYRAALSDAEIWQLVLYLRTFAPPAEDAARARGD
jgi:mono/diheme cytochrome c family protein